MPRCCSIRSSTSRRSKEIDKHGKPTGKLAVSLDDIEHFRQLGSKTPGHPGISLSPPASRRPPARWAQGCGNSVGMAIAERWLAAHFNRDGFPLFDHDVYVICGDGDMMEGISGEAASLAGHLKLSNLCWIYDSNTISIEGHTDLAFTEDVGKRFEAYGWNVHASSTTPTTPLRSPQAIEAFKATDDRPTFIVVQSIIGWGSPKAGQREGPRRAARRRRRSSATKEAYGWPRGRQFLRARRRDRALLAARSPSARSRCARRGRRCSRAIAARIPELAAELDTMLAGKLPEGWDDELPDLRRRRQGHRQPRRGRQGAERDRRARCRGWSAARPISRRRPRPTDRRRAARSSRATMAAATCISACASMRMGAIANGMALSLPARLRRHLPGLLRLHAPADPARGDHGAADRSSSSRTIRSASARTARPTSRSSISPRCARSRASTRSARATPTRSPRRGRSRSSRTQTPTALIFSRQALPTLDRTKYATRPRACRRAAMCWPTDEGTPDVILIATGSELSPRGRRARERSTEDGVDGRASSRCRAGISSRSRTRPIATACCRRRSRARVAVEQARRDRLGPLCRRSTAPPITMSTLRRLGAARQAAGEVRLHRRQCRQGRPRSDGEAGMSDRSTP